jgi:hypothetical protein
MSASLIDASFLTLVGSLADLPIADPDYVPTPLEELVFRIAAIESVANAKFDAAIESLRPTESDDAPVVADADGVADLVGLDAPEAELGADLAEVEAEPEAGPRSGRHVSDEVSLSIHSFVAGKVARHRIETPLEIVTLAS